MAGGEAGAPADAQADARADAQADAHGVPLRPRGRCPATLQQPHGDDAAWLPRRRRNVATLVRPCPVRRRVSRLLRVWGPKIGLVQSAPHSPLDDAQKARGYKIRCGWAGGLAGWRWWLGRLILQGQPAKLQSRHSAAPAKTPRLPERGATAAASDNQWLPGRRPSPAAAPTLAASDRTAVGGHHHAGPLTTGGGRVYSSAR